MAPTISAATEDQVHKVRIRSACLVTPVGQPKRSLISQSWALQPVSNTAVLANRPSRVRRLFRLRCTGETAFLCTDLDTDLRAYRTPARRGCRGRTSPVCREKY